MSHRLYTSNHGVRVVLMGSSSVGKTSIIRRFLYNTFETRYTKTIEDMYRTSYKGCQIDLLDTTGSHHFPMMQDFAITTGDMFVLVFSRTDGASFERLYELVDKIRAMNRSGAKIIVVENKCDLVNTATRHLDAEIVVTMHMGCVYHECSAKNDENIMSLFGKVVDIFVGRKTKQTIGLMRTMSKQVQRMACCSSSSSTDE